MTRALWIPVATLVGGWIFYALHREKPVPAAGPPASPSSGASHDRVIEGLRGLFLTVVVVEHFAIMFTMYLPSFGQRVVAEIPLWTPGSASFLLLSSYFTYGAFVRNPQRGHGQYLLLRLKRILPPYWVMLVVYIPFVILAGRTDKLVFTGHSAVGTILANILMIAPIVNRPSIIASSWTLSYILLLYCVGPLVAKACHRWGSTLGKRVLIILGFGAVCWAWDRFHIFGLAQYCTVTMGMLVWEFRQWAPFQRFLKVLGEGGVLLGSALLVAAAYQVSHQTHFPIPTKTLANGLYASGIGVFVAYRFTHEGLLNRMLCNSWFKLLGDLSYSIYLTHGAVLFALFAIVKPAFRPGLNGTWVFLCAMVAAYFLCVMAASLYHQAVEVRLSLQRKPGALQEKEPSPARAMAARALSGLSGPGLPATQPE
jgi:peptidoglycan/LPS O-acetylase OafA/YrhL